MATENALIKLLTEIGNDLDFDVRREVEASESALPKVLCSPIQFLRRSPRNSLAFRQTQPRTFSFWR